MLIKDKKNKKVNTHDSIIASFNQFYCSEKKNFINFYGKPEILRKQREIADYDKDNVNKSVASDCLKKAEEFFNAAEKLYLGRYKNQWQQKLKN